MHISSLCGSPDFLLLLNQHLDHCFEVQIVSSHLVLELFDHKGLVLFAQVVLQLFISDGHKVSFQLQCLYFVTN